MADSVTAIKHACMHRLKPHQQFAISFYLLTVLISLTYSLAVHDPPANYFTNKRNVLNVFFVKQGWLWTTVVYGAYLYLIQSRKQPIEQGMARYLLVSLYWYGMTQWLLGPSFIERIFVATGGQCRDPSLASIANVYQQAVCRARGGIWSGGHDVSGHCVLLIHSSMFLWEEIAWVWYSIPAVQRIRNEAGHAWTTLKAVFVILVFWWWMLVVTSVYFHGRFELVTGCIFGLAGWAILYIGIFPRIPAIGLPPIQI